jgi:hypothetical protein
MRLANVPKGIFSVQSELIRRPAIVRVLGKEENQETSGRPQ